MMILSYVLQVFNGVDICRQQGLDSNVRNIGQPVVARIIRIVPLAWKGESSCLKLELYGCLVEGYYYKIN